MNPLMYLLLSTAHAVPLQLTQQGRLLDNTGAAVTGVHTLDFRIYDDLSTGQLLYEESLSVVFNNGYYAVTLGSDEQNNPLDESVLSLYPLFIELEIDNGGALSPRQAILSAPYAQLSGVSTHVSGGLVDATQVSIGGNLIIDANGSWVGPTIATAWNDITGIPADIADGDNDTQLTESQVENYVTNGSINLAIGSTVDNDDIVTLSTDSDTLADMSCTSGDVAKYDAVVGWYCDIDADTLQDLNCNAGQIAYFNGNVWVCNDFSNLIDQDSDGVLSWNDCDDNDPTALSQAYDGDCDGILTADDCDDADPNSTAIVDDGDCDGVLTADDCNDADPNLLANADDGDCDGVLTVDDCDDNNPLAFNNNGQSLSCAAVSCLELSNDGYTANGLYFTNVGGVTQQVYCDLTTDGGGWTVFYAATGADGQQPLTSNTIQTGNPLTFGHYNTTRSFKIALSSSASETLFFRNNGAWIKANHGAFDSNLANGGQHAHYSVSLTTSNGATANGFMGWSNTNISGGGDFNLSMTDGGTCNGSTTQGVDHHGSNYYHLNCSCERHYLYSYSNSSGDGDAGYDVNTGLGSWGSTSSCDSGEGGSLTFYVGMR